MRLPFRFLLPLSLLLGSLLSCVDPEDLTLRGTVDVVVVDGTITNLNEPQIIRLNRSKADPLTGRPGSTPLTKAVVEVIVDSAEVVACHETENGTYQLPTGFRGRIGHAYQLRFTLANGTRYLSTQQIMPSGPPIQNVTAQFNPSSLPPDQLGDFTAAHDLYIDTQDPAGQKNFYRWDWKLWESQDWCKSCTQGRYSVNNVLINYSSNGFQYFQAGDSLLEDCFYPPITQTEFYIYDYPCRTRCWAIVENHDLTVFSDIYSNGGLIAKKKVAQIPFYQRSPCLVQVRQAALTASAYQFYNQLAEQTQRTGGVTDLPPTVLAGNVHNIANREESVVGIFTASGVATSLYWLDRKDTQGVPPGLFEALNGRVPNPEPSIPGQINKFQIIWSHAIPPFTAICSSVEDRTPYKPEGWRD